MSGQVGVEVVLTAGRSKTDRVQFTPQVAATRAIVGAAATADWSIAAPGLDAEHAEIAWDGAQLWVRDNGSRVGTWVGSQKLTQDWRVLKVGEQVRLGQAMLTVQAMGASAGGGDEEFDDEATRVNAGSGAVGKAPSTDDDAGESTMIVNTAQQPMAPAAAPVMAASAPPRVNTVPPKVNVAKPAGIAPQSNVAAVIGEGTELSAFAQSLHAQMQAGAAPGMQAGVQAGMQAGMHAGVQPMTPVGHGPMMGGAVTGYPPQGGYGVDNPFAPPPSSEQSLFGSIPPADAPLPTPAQPQQKLLFGALPVRTVVMLSVVLVVAVVVILLPDDPPPQPVARPVPPELTAPQPPWQQPVPGPSAGDARIIHLNANAPPPPAPQLQPGQRPPRNAPPPPPQSSFPERRAADLVVQNRIREAIPLYQALQIAHPDQPVYRDMLILLHRKLEAQLCPPGSPTPCPNAPALPALQPPTGAAPSVAPVGAPTAPVAVQPVPGAAPPAPQGATR